MPSPRHRQQRGKGRENHAGDRGQRQGIAYRVLRALQLAAPDMVTDRWLIRHCGIPDASLAYAIHRLRYEFGYGIQREGHSGYRLHVTGGGLEPAAVSVLSVAVPVTAHDPKNGREPV